MSQLRPFVSASRRTDIPAWYAPWFMNRFRAGWCEVSNPFNPGQTTTVSLSPKDVRALFFWTRWPQPILGHIEELRNSGLRFIFHVTLTGYPSPLEPFPICLEERVAAIRRLSELIGPELVWWRYDPVILGTVFNHQFHIENFSYLSRLLEGATHRVTVSAVDWYRKTSRRLSEAESQTGPLLRLPGNAPELIELASRLGEMARKKGITPFACCEPSWEKAGFSMGGCIDALEANRLFGLDVEHRRDPGQRPDCLCAPSYDIGAPDSCIGGCLYCYSTSSHDVAGKNYLQHDPKGLSMRSIRF